jgi:diaminopimelate decarboxylase
MARYCIKTGREFGHSMEFLDLGGGYPASDLNENLIEALTMTKNDPLGYEVMAEPGRHFSATSCHLGMRVIGKRNK